MPNVLGTRNAAVHMAKKTCLREVSALGVRLDGVSDIAGGCGRS